MVKLLKAIIKWLEKKDGLSWNVEKYFDLAKLDRDYYDKYQEER